MTLLKLFALAYALLFAVALAVYLIIATRHGGRTYMVRFRKRRGHLSAEYDPGLAHRAKVFRDGQVIE